MEKIFEGVFREGKYLYTQALVKGQVYGERIIKEGNVEYRAWDPFRSKLAAAIKKGLKLFPFKNNSKVLYLGASTGTTVSHLSDICIKGEVYAVEFSHQVGKQLIALSEKRENIIPIIADARKPGEYEEVGQVEMIYQDVAQPDQADILIKNAKKFLNKKGIAMFAVKSQSIDVTKTPESVFEDVEKELQKYFNILERIRIEPFDKDHLFLVLEFR